MGLSKIFALLLIPAYMLTIAILAPFNINYVFEPGFLLPVTNTLFAGLLPIVVAYIGARVYLVTGSSSVMFMGCGMFAFGLAAISAGWLIGRSGGPNINVTIYNSGALVSASFHILGAFLFLKGSIGSAEPRRGKLKVLSAYGVVLGLVALLSLLAVHEVFPPFFIQGIGPTVLRQEILGTAIILYILSSVFFMYQYLNWKFDFFYWYSLALALLAIGLFAFLVQSAVGSPIGWVGRSANYFGGIFSLIAVLIAGRVARSKSLSLEESISIFFSDAESSYKSLVEASSDAIVSFDQEDRIIGWNTSAGNMFGHTREEALESSFFEFVIPEKYVAVLKKDIESVIARSNTSSLGSSIEIQGKRGDGSQFPVEVSVSVRELPTGRVITCNIRDITRRKQDEDSIRRLNETLEMRVAQRTAELRESEEKYRNLVESISDVIFEIDGRGLLTYISPVVRNVIGYEAEDLIGKTFLEFVHPEDRELLMNRFSELTKGVEYPLEYRIVGKSDEVRYVRTYTRPIMKENTFEGARGTLIDITERKRAGEALRQSEDKFSKAFHLNPDAILITRLVDGMIVSVNEGFKDIFGSEEEEVIGKTSMELNIWVNPEDRNRIIEGMRDDGKLSNFEARFRTKNGDIIHGLMSVSIIHLDGVEHILSITRDITELVALQEQLIQAQKMEAVGALAGGVAHDFNNLLQSILGYSEFMLQRKKEGETDYNDIQKIHQAGMRGADLVKSLLTFSRKVETKRVPVKLNQEITQVQELLSRTIPKTIKIDLHLSWDLESINADPSQIGQILMNLGVNARDAMPDGGTLTIETANVQLDKEYCRSHLDAMPGNYVLLTVSDTGQGMDRKILTHIFEPFFSTKEVGKGTGLGLAIVYGIVKQHDGHIICYSEPGHGTTFKIYLPATQTKKDLETPTFETAIPGGTETILLVDDDNDIRDLAATILIDFGYKVITAANGKEAVEIYQREGKGISLVILDLIMPEMDGRQCLTEILRIDPNAKVIMSSGHPESRPADDVMAGGATGFVQKPYNMSQLLTTIRVILDKD